MPLAVLQGEGVTLTDPVPPPCTVPVPVGEAVAAPDGVKAALNDAAALLVNIVE